MAHVNLPELVTLLPLKVFDLNSSDNSTNKVLIPTIGLTSRNLIGLALSISGNLFISVSLSVQKKAHNRLGQENGVRYCLDGWWWLGMMLMVCGEFGNFMAYGFAPASLVAPLGSIAVIANAIIAFVFLREPISMSSIMGVTFVIVGSVILISFSMKGKPPLASAEIIVYLKAWSFLLYIGIELVILAILLYLKYVRGNEHMIVLLLMVGIIASVTIIAAKALSTMLSETIIQGRQHVLNVVFWASLFILPITTATQIHFLNRAMQLYDVSDVVPVNFIFFTISAILAGSVFYKEFKGVQFDRIFMFLFGCVLSFIGVYIIAHEEESNVKKETRERSATGDSGLDPGSATTEESDISFSSDDLSLSDAQSPTCEEIKYYHQSPAGDRERISNSSSSDVGETSQLVIKENSPKSAIIVCRKMLDNFFRAVKSSETTSFVQPDVTTSPKAVNESKASKD